MSRGLKIRLEKDTRHLLAVSYDVLSLDSIMRGVGSSPTLRNVLLQLALDWKNTQPCFSTCCEKTLNSGAPLIQSPTGHVNLALLTGLPY